MRLKHARAILGDHLPPFTPSARAVVRAFSFGDISAEALPALSRRKLTFTLIYPYALRTRKSAGLMTRKLSVTESQKTAQFFGTSTRRKCRTDRQKSL
jgi:hypothetical protein